MWNLSLLNHATVIRLRPHIFKQNIHQTPSDVFNASFPHNYQHHNLFSSRDLLHLSCGPIMYPNSKCKSSVKKSIRSLRDFLHLDTRPFHFTSMKRFWKCQVQCNARSTRSVSLNVCSYPLLPLYSASGHEFNCPGHFCICISKACNGHTTTAALTVQGPQQRISPLEDGSRTISQKAMAHVVKSKKCQINGLKLRA